MYKCWLYPEASNKKVSRLAPQYFNSFCLEELFSFSSSGDGCFSINFCGRIFYESKSLRVMKNEGNLKKKKRVIERKNTINLN